MESTEARNTNKKEIEMTSAKKMTNRDFSVKDKWFNTVCRDFCIVATVRQASKWRRNMGLAYKLANLI